MLFECVIRPIEYIVEFVFLFITRKFDFIGIFGAIICVSLVINFLALPLYNIADSIKEKENLLQKKMEPQIKRIKSVFKGDERFMIVQTYYKQNNYNPLYSLRSSLAILIEIPFFIAAYHYLSNNPLLSKSILNFGLFTINLGEADHIFKIGNFYINILPIVMTIINLLSGSVYTKNASTREKIQIFSLAALFLVLLYNSPSGLVFYWICNNLFSLGKNIVLKTKNPKKITFFIICCLLLLFSIAFIFKKNISIKNLLIVWSFTILFCIIPFIKKLLKKTNFSSFFNSIYITNFKLFFISSLGLTLLFGLVIPSNVISSSPLEFALLGKIENPSYYVLNSLAFFAGIFLLWSFTIYKMFGNKVKIILTYLYFTLFVCSLLNTFVFKFNYGVISQTYAFENINVLKDYNNFFDILSVLCFFIVSILFFIQKKKKYFNIVFTLILSICFAETSLGIYKLNTISKSYTKVSDKLIETKKTKINTISPIFHLSKTEKNVVILFLDRAINGYFPDILKLYPNLKESYTGFTYYPNTISFGDFTILGAPAMMAGYEYIPIELNKRNDKNLREKHNEASLIMPKLFLDKDWNVTITDPPLPNYSEQGDFTAYEEYPQINISTIEGKYASLFMEEQNMERANIDIICKKQTINFSIIQTLLPCFRYYFYNIIKDDVDDCMFEQYYSSLYYFNKLTDFSSNKNSFFFIGNDSTHPTADAPNWGTNCGLSDTEISNVYNYQNSRDLVHFRVNALSFNQIGKWLDYLKENNVYDNTRIIIVSDHGRNVNIDLFKDFVDPIPPVYFSAMLLFKDFNQSEQLKIDNTFMTNADTIFLTKKDLSLSDINPFTGNKFIQHKDGKLPLYKASTFNQNKIANDIKFILDNETAWTVHDNIFINDNWEKLSSNNID